jgi:predicted esterase
MDGGMSKYVRQDIPAEFYSLMAENTPGLVPIKMPIVMVQGMKDTTIIPQLTLAFDKQLCLAGNTVDFHIYPNDTHPGVVVNSSQMINQWIADRFAGKPAPNNCSNQ